MIGFKAATNDSVSMQSRGQVPGRRQISRMNESEGRVSVWAILLAGAVRLYTALFSAILTVIDAVASRSLGYFWHRITAKTSRRVDAAVSHVLSSQTVIRPVSLISLREKQRERQRPH